MGMLSTARRPVIECDPEKGAKQSFKDECDINHILARHRVTGMVTHVNANQGRFADVSGFDGDYRAAVERVREASKFFGGLPAATRAEFANDPAAFLDALTDPRQKPLLEELGLFPVLEEAEADVVDSTASEAVEEAE